MRNSMMKTLGIIPARYASTRFPGKPLTIIDGKTMIQRVYEQAKKSQYLDRIIVATDDTRIYTHVQGFGGEAMMTSSEHLTGTDRCAEVVNQINVENIVNPDNLIDKTGRKRINLYNFVVNIQGDEPYIDPKQIDKIIDVLKKNIFPIVTLAKSLDTLEDIQNPNIVKVVFDKESGEVVLFSRSAIPYLRDIPLEKWADSREIFKHIGLYGFQTSVLLKIAQLKPHRLEKLESLEQLRWLGNGYKMGISETDIETISIDTPNDINKLIF